MSPCRPLDQQSGNARRSTPADSIDAVCRCSHLAGDGGSLPHPGEKPSGVLRMAGSAEPTRGGREREGHAEVVRRLDKFVQGLLAQTNAPAAVITQAMG